MIVCFRMAGMLLLFVSLPDMSAQTPPVPTNSDEVIARRLVDALKDPDPEVRQHLAQALAKLGPVAMGPLTSALKDERVERRAGAAYCLGLIGLPARSALPELLNALDDADNDVRRQAAFAISRIIPAWRNPNSSPGVVRVPGGSTR